MGEGKHVLNMWMMEIISKQKEMRRVKEMMC